MSRDPVITASAARAAPGPGAPSRATPRPTAPSLTARALGLCALLLLGAGCRDGNAPAPTSTPASATASGSPPAAGGPEAAGSTGSTALAPAGASAAKGAATTTASGTGWQRTRAAEPDPAARALYRRALDLLAAGQAVQAAPILAQLRRDHPESRFGARLDAPDARFGGAIGALVAAGAGLATASGLMRARAADSTPPAAPASAPPKPAGP